MTFELIGIGRIEVDRMWRSPHERAQFVRECPGFNYDDQPAEFEQEFIEWALNKVNNAHNAREG
jgi:hypothetical protein